MEMLKALRRKHFANMGKYRLTRVITCSFAVALVWYTADWMGGRIEPNFWQDLMCVGIGLIAERLIPWGKSNEGV